MHGRSELLHLWCSILLGMINLSHKAIWSLKDEVYVNPCTAHYSHAGQKATFAAPVATSAIVPSSNFCKKLCYCTVQVPTIACFFFLSSSFSSLSLLSFFFCCMLYLLNSSATFSIVAYTLRLASRNPFFLLMSPHTSMVHFCMHCHTGSCILVEVAASSKAKKRKERTYDIKIQATM